MSTWKILSDAENSFCWEVSHAQLLPVVQLDAPPTTSSRLPSMSDFLLLQGCCSKLLEEEERNTHNNDTNYNSNNYNLEDSPLIFRTASGKHVATKNSSLHKALSLLRPHDFEVPKDKATPSQQEFGGDGNSEFSNSMFQTASGKAVNISASGLNRAMELLDFKDNYDNPTIQSREFKVKTSVDTKQHRCHSSSDQEMRMDAMPASKVRSNCIHNDPGNAWREGPIAVVISSGRCNSDVQPPIKFHTAGGRSISVSSNALQRARSLLGDPDLGTITDTTDGGCSLFQAGKLVATCPNKENVPFASISHHGKAMGKNMSTHFIAPLSTSDNHLSIKTESTYSGTTLIKKSDAACFSHPCRSKSTASCPPKEISNTPEQLCGSREKSLHNGIGTGTNSGRRSSYGPLVDISNSSGIGRTSEEHVTGEKRRLGRKHSKSPFKKPRNSRFSAPLSKNMSHVQSGVSGTEAESCCRSQTVSTRYPFPFSRMYIKDYFGSRPSHHHMLGPSADELISINPNNAQNYMFADGSGVACIGVDAFVDMLALSGASMQHASREWVANHYKWIIWKLGCYDRCYPTKSAGNFLTVFNVLEELKYRYEREVNHGHRSAIKRVLEGDASPSSMMVLCVSAIHSIYEKDWVAPNRTGNCNSAKVELTDGWYSVDAVLDILLTKQLAAGKLYVGQKLRVWGAELCSWVGPISPLEAPNAVSMLLYMNGTYRAHWADRLGLCKGHGSPLAFRCIKSAGGPVPQTLVGVTRIYPVLYKERLNCGGSVVRSEKMEDKMIQIFNQRRSIVVEGITSELERSTAELHKCNDSDSEEGAKIFNMLETAAEPEIMMAEMSSTQLTLFAAYQQKMEITRDSDIQNSIAKALEDAGLSRREVTPFMRVKVVGLSTKGCQGKDWRKEGLITIWEPTEKQCLELVEGQSYAISGLTPSTYISDVIFLQGKGCMIKWQPLPTSASKEFEPFYTPRISVFLSNLGDVSLSSEFDIAALVVYVGEIYKDSHQRKQWVFVTDGSISVLKSGNLPNSLLAISFSFPDILDDSFAPINSNLVGCTVGFCNLIKRAKDQINQIWLADATENTIYSSNYELPQYSHLKNAAASVQRWANISNLIIERLREKIFSVLHNPSVQNAS